MNKKEKQQVRVTLEILGMVSDAFAFDAVSPYVDLYKRDFIKKSKQSKKSKK